MSTIVIQHPVTDFEAWKKSFDSDPLGRASSGVTQHTIYRSTEEPNYVVVHLEFGSPEQARTFLPRLRELWRRVGDKIGFAPAEVQVRLFDEAERLDY